MPAATTVLAGGSVGVFQVMTDGTGYRFVPEAPVLLYSLSPGGTRTNCGIGLRHCFSGVRPNAAYNLIPTGETYTARTLQPPSPLLFACIGFREADLRGLLMPGTDVALRAVPRLVAEDVRVDRLVRLLAEGGTGEPDDLLLRGHALLALAAAVLGVVPHASTGRAGALDALRLARVRAYIEENLATQIPLYRLAEVASLSAFHFARAFRMATGLPPATYIRARRIERARALLRSSGLPIAEIGRRVGYADPTRFADRFRREVGVSPKAYRLDEYRPVD